MATVTREEVKDPRLRLNASAALACTALGALVAGTLAYSQPLLAVGAIIGIGLVVCVWAYPATAALLVVGVTPLVVGIDRGRVLPLLRPNEALFIVLAGVLVARGLIRARSGTVLRARLHPLEWSMVLMAVAASFLPLLWMLVRGQHPSADDITYALVLWKYLGIFVLVRVSVSTDRQVRWCLLTSVAVATVVALLAILQALNLMGVRELMTTWWTAEGTNQDTINSPRAGATMELPAAAADLFVFNLAILAGVCERARRRKVLRALPALILVPGVFAAGEFSSVLALIVGAIAVAFALQRVSLLRYGPLVLVGTGILMWPVIEHRLVGFQGVHKLPISWITRLANLRTYFWPEILSGPNVLFGVRPSARVPVPSQDTGYVWIESGYVWLLWGGGVPLFAAFINFVRVGARMTLRLCRPLTSWTSIAALAAFTGVTVVVVGMVFDPHLTYRGSADSLFSLLALSMTARARQPASADVPESVHHLPEGGRPLSSDGTQPRPSRLGRARVWIMIFAVAAAVAAAIALFAFRPPTYVSSSSVVIRPDVSRGPVIAPQMGTEAAIASSGVVLKGASNLLHESEAALQRGLSVSNPVDTTVLVVAFKGATPSAAYEGANAITRAYVDYRNSSGDPHAAEVISPATIPRHPSSVNYVLVVTVAAACGLLVGLAVILVVDLLLRKRSDMTAADRQPAPPQPSSVAPAGRPHARQLLSEAAPTDPRSIKDFGRGSDVGA